MTSDHAASVMGITLQGTSLAANGTPLVGTQTSYSTSAFMKFAFTPQYTTGTDVEEKAADGSVCVYYRSADVLKNVNFNLSVCDPAPELHGILTGGVVLVPYTGASATGYAASEIGIDETPNGVAIEVWSRAIVAGRPATVNPFWRWVFPFCKMKYSGDMTMEGGAMAVAFEGWGYGNASYGGGANGDWYYETDRAFAFNRYPTAPAGINDYVAVTAHNDAVQTVTITGTPSGGTYTLSYGGQTTSGISPTATASTVQAALGALTSIYTNNVSVTGSAGGPYQVTFINFLGNQPITLMTANSSGLTGGTSPTVTVTMTTAGM